MRTKMTRVLVSNALSPELEHLVAIEDACDAEEGIKEGETLVDQRMI